MSLVTLSEKSQNVLKIAAIESQRLNHYYIGTEHLFIGLCKIEDMVIKEIFDEFNIDPLIRGEIRAKIGTGGIPIWGHKMIFTPRVNKILKIANEIAKTYQPSKVEPAYLLLSLLKAGEGISVRVLKEKCFDIEKITSSIEEMLDKSIEEVKLFPSAQKTPFLNKIGKDLTLLAHQGKIGPVIGRNKEIMKMARILTMKKKNNPILIGDAGVGKTAAVEGLALKLIMEDMPGELKGLRIIEVNLSTLIAGTKYRGDFEERINKMVEEATKNKEVILFIDEIHNLMGAGSAGGTLDASNILKPVLARAQIRCIGATTIAEYRRYIEKDTAFERRFQIIYINEPTRMNTLQIIQGLRSSYEDHYNIKITDEAIDASVRLSIRYIPDRKLPDKAIDLIDQAAAKVKLKSITIKPEDHETIAHKSYEDDVLAVNEEDIAFVVAEWTGIPVNKLSKEDTEGVLKIEESLRERVIGQGKAIKAVAHTIRTAKAGLRNPNCPMGVFLFLGPTGVGKTELAKTLTHVLFDDENKMIRFDMSEYMEKHTVSKLIGAPPGYIGHEQEGQLTGRVRTHPHSVILFDEIEKAHPDIHNLFLQVFDEGRLTDSRGKKVDFTNTIIIMTSNIESRSGRKKMLGFAQSEETDPMTESKNDTEEVNVALNKKFRQEFLNRIDKIILFNHLGNKEIQLIIDKLLNRIREYLAPKGLALYVSEKIYDFLIKNGYSETYGVREMDRIIQKKITEPLAEELLKNKFRNGDKIYIGIESEKILFIKKESTDKYDNTIQN